MSVLFRKHTARDSGGDPDQPRRVRPAVVFYSGRAGRRDSIVLEHALIRRASRVSPEDVYVFEDVIVDLSKTEVTRCGEKVTVTTKEFKTLEFFTKNADHTSPRMNSSMKFRVSR